MAMDRHCAGGTVCRRIFVLVVRKTLNCSVLVTVIGGYTKKMKTQQELAALLIDAAIKVTVGARYEHYKKQTYTVVALALREEDCAPCVVYRAEYGDGVTFIRPVTNWLETVETDGKIVPRFAILST